MLGDKNEKCKLKKETRQSYIVDWLENREL